MAALQGAAASTNSKRQATPGLFVAFGQQPWHRFEPGEGQLSSGALSTRDRRILVVLPKGIGDVVYGLALVTALKDAHPETEITWVVQPAAAPLLREHPAIASVLTYAPSGGLRALLDLRRQLSTVRFDVVLNLGMYVHALPPVLLARARRRVGFDRGYSRDGLSWFHGEKVAAPIGVHVMEVYKAALRYLGVPSPTFNPHLHPRPRELELREDFFASALNRPKVALVPCSGRPEKDWHARRYGELASRLHKETGAFVVVTGGPSVAEASAADVIATMAPDTRLAVGDDLRRVLWILSGCDLVVAGDTGPIHLARALGTPVVGLYGHTDPQRYGPYPPFRGRIIDRYRYDSPGVLSAFQGQGGRPGRMELIQVGEVVAACASILNAGRPSEPADRQGHEIS